MEYNSRQVGETDFFLKINSPSAGRNSVDSAYYSAVSASLMNPLTDCSNYLPFCHTHYFILQINTSLSLAGQTLYQDTPLETLILHCCSALLQNLFGNSGVTQYLEEAEHPAEASVDVPPPPLQIVISQSTLRPTNWVTQNVLLPTLQDHINLEYY